MDPQNRRKKEKVLSKIENMGKEEVENTKLEILAEERRNEETGKLEIERGKGKEKIIELPVEGNFNSEKEMENM